MIRSNRTFALLIITLYTVTGLFIYTDYGISWDEIFQRDYGKFVYEYVFNDDQTLHSHGSRYHGPAGQFFLYSTQQFLGITDSQVEFETRHLLTFLFSVVGFWFFYRLLLLLRFNTFWAAMGMLFFMCSPRIFAHSFYNSKDAVFMHLFVIAVYTMVKFLRRPNWRSALWHGLTCGLLIDVRILGLFVPMITGILWLGQLVENRQSIKESWLGIAVFGTSTILTVFVFWPTLWHAPFLEFQNAIAKMSDYPWDDHILFEGSFSYPKDLPWYYLPKWMLITTPVFFSVMSVLGLVTWFLNHRISVSEKLIPFLWVFLPFGLILWKGATVYDGWRHVFFLYPAILIMAVYGAERMFGTWIRHRKAKWVPLLFLLSPVTFMVQAHPHQQVFFNPLVEKNVWDNYELDYWGLSYKQALEVLVEHVPEGEIKLKAANFPGYNNHWILPQEQRDRIQFVSVDSADYFISNFRFVNEHNAFDNRSGFYSDPIEIIEVDGNPIVGVFRLEKN